MKPFIHRAERSYLGLLGERERERERKTERSVTWLQCEQCTHTHTPGSLCLVTPDINRQLINERKGRVYAGGERKTGERERGKKVKIKIVQLPHQHVLSLFLSLFLSFALSLFLEQVILQHKSMLAGQAASY